MENVDASLKHRATSTFRRHYREHGREFPWRKHGVSPFGILIAEMLLRQTRAEQVARVWPSLIEAYPSPRSLAAADLADLHSRLTELGLVEQRVEALRGVASVLDKRPKGAVPKRIESLLSMPHVGRYVAHAVACFAFGARVAVVDANVLRVLGRIFGRSWGTDNRRAPGSWELATELLPVKGSARDYNYGLLDFAATICTARKPLCRKCPLNAQCAWAREHIWAKTDFSVRPPNPPWPR